MMCRGAPCFCRSGYEDEAGERRMRFAQIHFDFVQRCEQRGERHAELEAQERVAVAAEDWDAVEDERVFARLGKAIVDRERRAVARIFRRLFDVFIVFAARISDEADGLAEVPLDGLLRARELVFRLVEARCLRELFMRQRVALKIDEAAFVHVLHVAPRQIVRIRADVIGNQKDRRLELIFLEDGERMVVVVEIAIVKCDDDGLLRQLRAVFPSIEHIGRRDGRVAVLREVFHLRFELFRVHGQRVLFRVVDLVIVQHGDAVLCGLEQPEHGKREQGDNGRRSGEQPFAAVSQNSTSFQKDGKMPQEFFVAWPLFYHLQKGLSMFERLAGFFFCQSRNRNIENRKEI